MPPTPSFDDPLARRSHHLFAAGTGCAGSSIYRAPIFGSEATIQVPNCDTLTLCTVAVASRQRTGRRQAPKRSLAPKQIGGTTTYIAKADDDEKLQQQSTGAGTACTVAVTTTLECRALDAIMRLAAVVLAVAYPWPPGLAQRHARDFR